MTNQSSFLIQGDADLITGTLKLHPRGFGFVKPDNAPSGTQEIFIPKHLTGHAVDGDSVEVKINTKHISEKGPEGKVTAILSRGRTHLAGIIQHIGRNGTCYAHAPLLGKAHTVIVETKKGEILSVGDRVIMEVIEWGGREGATLSRLCRIIGHISDPSYDIEAAIEEFELRINFAAKALQEAKAFGNTVPAEEMRRREDLRKIICLTIDPETAKDFDDAVSLKKDERGCFHLGVHIADVSHYVTPGSSLDEEAQMRCNSTYFPGYCLPMLPKELSDNLCSLKPNVNRLAVSVFMTFTDTGDLTEYRISRTVIKSAKRFTYKEAKAVLDGKKNSPYKAALELMVELCGLLKKKRYERGSVEFGLPELVVLVDKKGAPTGTDYVVYDITHQLIEEFMLKANEIVALHLGKQGKYLPYRIHEEPTEENMKDFSLLASAFGFHLPEVPTPRDIQILFDEAMSTPYGPYLASSYIRRMRLAVYSADNIGHFGLSLAHYCHFTSPIRRYVDLVSHRLLFQEGEEKEKLEMISANCSEQERISAKAETSVTLLKKLRLLNRRHQENPHHEYEAVVTRVKPFGVIFEILDLLLEGYFHVSELGGDYYVYDDSRVILRGRSTGHTFHAGDKIWVMLKEVDLITQESEWFLLAERPKHQNRFKGRKRRK